MHITLHPDDFTPDVAPLAHHAVRLIATVAGLGNVDEIDEPIDVYDTNRAIVTAALALLDIAYDPPTPAVADNLTAFLESVKAYLHRA